MLNDATFDGPPLVINTPDGMLYRKYNYKLCEAIDLLKLSIVLGDMVESGHLHPQLAKIYKAQTEGLLQAIRSENNRAFGV